MVFTNAWFFPLILFTIFPCDFGANILISSLYGEGSHFMLGASIGEGLVERGHNVTFLIGRAYEGRTTDPQYANFSFAVFDHQSKSVHDVRHFWHQKFAALAVEGSGTSQLLSTISLLTDMMAEDCEGILLNETMMRRLEVIDAVVVDNTWPCAMYIKVLIEQRTSKKVRAISVFPFTPQGVPLYLYGSSYNPAYQPEHTTGLSNHMSFLQRTVNLVVSVSQTYLAFRMIVPIYGKIIDRVGISQDVLKMSAGYHLFDLHLMSMDFSSEYPFPLAPNFIPVGGLTASPAGKPSEELESFLQGSEESGFIVFTLGTYFASVGEYRPGFTEMFIEVFRKLPQRVIWQLESYPKENLPSNVKAMAWVPQNDLLGHPQIRAFVSQGGNNGFQEACYHGVPMVVIPLHGDQYDVATRVESKGMGRKLNKFDINSDLVFDAIYDVINSPKYSAAAKRISEIRKSMPMTPRERAAFWIEHVIRFGGEYLKPPVYELSFVQYYMFDVLLFLFAIFLGASLAIFYAIRCCVSLICRTGVIIKKDKKE